MTPPDPLRALPDVPIVLGYVLVVLLLVVVGDPAPPVRFLLVGPLLLFLPGYAATTALFPRSPDPYGVGAGREGATRPGTVDGVERAALSFGLSVASLPLVGVVLSLSTGSIGGPVTSLLGAFVVGATLLGAARRLRLPPERRFVVPLHRWVETARGGLTRPSLFDRTLNLLLGLGIVLAVAALALGFAAPQEGESFTEFLVGTEADDGEFVTAGYPDGASPGEEVDLLLLIENNEGEPVEYVVVTELQRVDENGEVIEATELDRRTVRTEPGESTVEPVSVSPAMEGEDLRLTYMLYRGDAPRDASRDSAYRSVHVWIDVGT